MTALSAVGLDELCFPADGLLPAVAQDRRTGEVLMVAFMSRESLARTLTTGDAWFWSRSRAELWHKGATSGNYLRVREVRRNCEDNSLLLLCDPAGPACHTGQRTCYFRTLDWLFAILRARQQERPEGSYTARLLAEGVDRIGKKIGEEAAEVIIAAKNRSPQELSREMADLWYHALVLLLDAGLTPQDVYRVLAERHAQQGGGR
jgi:phosphoribosyl-ATP pyrophosphohydrolase/phosphoribosyl-AMP cyclohydrolase